MISSNVLSLFPRIVIISSIDLNNFQNGTLFSRNFVTTRYKEKLDMFDGNKIEDRIFAEKKIGKLGICSS